MDSNSTDISVGQPIVIDNGSGVLKAGFAEEEKPSCIIPNYIGRPKYNRIPSMKSDIDEDKYLLINDRFSFLPSIRIYGVKAQTYKGVLSLSYPIEHGIIKNWNDMEDMWRYVFSKEQLNVNPEDHPVRPLCSRSMRS